MRFHGAADESDTAVLIGGALDKPLMLQGAEAIDRGLVGDNLAPELDFSNEGGLVVLCEIALNIVQHYLLLTC